ncbi:NADPH-Fe(3+) oxidoreductase subunit alpha [subsurface metagenome]
MIKLEIDKKEIMAKKGETVLEVAQRQGIYIPALCYHKDLVPYGGCRLCIVEVKGWSVPVASCTLPVEDGMVVRTDTPRLKKLRRFSLQLILSEHPHACLICDKEEECAQYQECIAKSAVTFGCKFCARNGDCELQELVEKLGIKEIPFEFSYRNLEVEKFDPFFERDYNLCILCGRCVRMCQEVRGAGTLDFQHRGQETLVGTAFNLPHIETGCQFCGACVDVCPTGALRDRYSKWLGLPQRYVKTTCMLCNIGCSIKINVRANTVVSSTPDNNPICVRGRFGIAPLVHHPKRITSPMLRKGERLVEVEWEEALDFVCTKLNEYKEKTGILFSSQLTIEAIDSVYGLTDHLKCKNLATTSALESSVGSLNLKGIESNTVFIVINTDMISDFSVLLLKLRSRLKDKPTFVVIDAVASKLTEIADLWLKPKLGKEGDVLKLLFAQKKMKNTTAVSTQNIKLGEDLLKKKNIYLLYNPYNIKNISVPKYVKKIPLTAKINTLKIIDMGVDSSTVDLLRDKNIDSLYLLGAAPKLNRKYKTIIVQDCFLPQIRFDLFLPTATFAEVNGSVVNIEGKIKKIRKAIEPLGKSKSDDWIITQISKRLNYNTKNRKPKKRKIITPAIAKDRRVGGKYPIHLIVRENSYSYRGHCLSDLMKGFERLRGDGYVGVNKRTAKKLRVKDGAEIKITGRALNLIMPARITEDVPENSVLVYYHPSMGAVNSQPVRITRKDK